MELDHTPEQAGCYQPRTGFGIVLLAISAVGIIGAGWSLRAAILVLLGRRPKPRVVAGAGVSLAAAGVFLLVVLQFTPDLQFGSC